MTDKQFNAHMAKVRAEFEALQKLYEQYRRMPAPVDDDFPEWDHNYTASLRTFITAVKERRGDEFVNRRY